MHNTCKQTLTHKHTHAYKHTHIQSDSHAHMCAISHMCVCMYVSVCVYVCVRACVRVCVGDCWLKKPLDVGHVGRRHDTHKYANGKLPDLHQTLENKRGPITASIYTIILLNFLKLFVSTDSTSSHEFASQFDLAIFYKRQTHKSYREDRVPRKCLLNAPVTFDRSIARDNTSDNNSDHIGERSSQNGDNES